MLEDPFIKESIDMCLNLEDAILKRHNDATHMIHRLEILVEFGLSHSDPSISTICEKILAHQSSEGAFLCKIFVPKSFQDPGKEQWDWITCDTPILLYFLANMGFRNDRRVLKAVDRLVGLVRENGLGSCLQFDGKICVHARYGRRPM